MKFEVTGKLIADLGTQQVSERFRRREFVIEIPDGNYTQSIKFQLVQDKCDLLDEFRQGESVKVHFNLSGRASQDRNGNTVYYTNLQAWRLDAGEELPAATGGGGGWSEPRQESRGGYDRGGDKNDRGGRNGGGGRDNDRDGGRPQGKPSGSKRRQYNDDDEDMPF